MCMCLIIKHKKVYGDLKKRKWILQAQLKESFPDFAISFLTFYTKQMNNPIIALKQGTYSIINNRLLVSEVNKIINTYDNFNEYDDINTNMGMLRNSLNDFATLIDTREAYEFVATLQLFFTSGFNDHQHKQLIDLLTSSQNSIIENRISRKISVLDSKMIFPISVIPVAMVCTCLYFISKAMDMLISTT